MSTSAMVMLATLVSMVVLGHVPPNRLPTPTTWACILRMLIRQTTTFAMVVSPSAASTQVVPNGGKKIDTGYIFPLQNRAHLFSRPPNWKNFIQLTSQNSFIPRYASSRSSCVIPR